MIALGKASTLNIILQVMIFHAQTIVLGFHHIADRYDPYEPSILQDRQVPNTVMGHLAHDFRQIFVQRTGHELGRHVVADGEAGQGLMTGGRRAKMSRSVMIPHSCPFSRTTSDPQLCWTRTLATSCSDAEGAIEKTSDPLLLQDFAQSHDSLSSTAPRGPCRIRCGGWPSQIGLTATDRP